ncbi:MAG: helix-turn-helix transcriptional regulator [Culturomica sp.]|jgi:AraC-like DNA-binding protein|nr:helix-turn-helix transcriptional regulator [Culturomica sp.]
MLLNVEKYINCYCNKDGKNQTIELREFIREETGTINFYAQEILFVVKGHIQITRENRHKSLKLNQGEFIFMPIGDKLSYRTSANSAMLSVRLIDGLPECHVYRMNRISTQLNLKKKRERVHVLKANDHIEHFLSGLLKTIKDGLTCAIYLQIEASRLLFLIHGYYPNEECIRFFYPVISPDTKFSEFVRKNYLKYRNTRELAEALCITPQQFSSRFRKVFGTTPHKWIIQEKAQLIYQDICHSNKQLKEIADEHGFSLQSNFTRFCRTAFGLSPGEIRKRLNACDVIDFIDLQ